MGENVSVTYRGKKVDYPAGTPLRIIARHFQEDFDTPIVLALVDYKLRELHHTVKKDCRLEFETLSDHIGHKAYKRSMCLLLIRAFYDVVGKEKLEKIKVEFSMGPGYYCSIKGDFVLDEDLVQKVKERMLFLVEENVPIRKKSYPLDEIRDRAVELRLPDKEKVFRYRRSTTVNMYNLGDYMDYYYGFMVPSTCYLKYFDVFLYGDGVILQMPERQDPFTVPPFQDMPGIFHTMVKGTKWGEDLGVETVGDLNECISNGRFNELVLTQEALHESEIASIARDIIDKKKEFVMVAGPSSSGKTSFSHRLSIQLLAHGMRPHPIALDNYFVNRDRTPLDSEGKLNYECLEALDLDEFNQNMSDLLAGKTVKMPTYNFLTGEREYKGNTLTMGKEDVLVIEGIHGLNDRLSVSLPGESKYKVYISALTTLNVDNHNRIPTTDGRLIRRLVRDHRTRGASAGRTLEMWGSVRRGEEKYIFPFQESADAIFNSAMLYELSVLKQFAEPLLFGIDRDEPSYQEAVRLLKFLQYFLGVSTEDLPKNSLIREFVGGSCFPV